MVSFLDIEEGGYLNDSDQSGAVASSGDDARPIFSLDARWREEGRRDRDMVHFHSVEAHLAGADSTRYQPPDMGQNMAQGIAHWLDLVGRECGAIGGIYEMDWQDVVLAFLNGELGKPQRRRLRIRARALAGRLCKGASAGPLPALRLFTAAFTLLDCNVPDGFVLPDEESFFEGN